MTASSNPDDHSYASKDAEPREQHGFVYDDPNASATEPESDYVREREFVLMPLFRRIGELLGVRRREEPEYVYQAAQEATPVEAATVEGSAGHDERSAGFVHPEPALASKAGQLHEPVQEWTQLEPTGLPEAIPVIPESQPLQAAAIHETPETSPIQEPEHPEAPPRLEPPSFAPATLHASHEEPLAFPKALEELEAPAQHREEFEREFAAEIQAPQTASHLPEELVAARSIDQVEAPRRRPAPRRKDEIDEAIAALREAGSKVSMAISQAVEWLSARERELVRKAERSLAPAPKTRLVQSQARTVIKPQAPVSQSAVEPVAAPSMPETYSNEPSVPKWEALQFPALQREISWTGQVLPAPVERRSANQPAAQAKPAVKRGPALVQRRRRVPFWKRIDWAAEFTPKRVAVLGGVLMAMLIVAGVTFARRPASEVLPPQPHTIQSGGVTVSIRPKAPAVTAPAQQSRKTGPPVKREVAPAARRAMRTVAPEEPDVVTHYYKQKPSPSKQSTVAGVKRYSDMN